MSGPIPISDNLVLVRTCFESDSRWAALLQVAKNPPDPFVAYFHVVDDPHFRDKAADEIVGALPSDYSHAAIFIADARAMSEADHPCLIVGIGQEEPHVFRAVARELAALDSNLSVANMDLEDFAGAASSDGIFRGFE